jgi:hypothetical protein
MKELSVETAGRDGTVRASLEASTIISLVNVNDEVLKEVTAKNAVF